MRHHGLSREWRSFAIATLCLPVIVFLSAVSVRFGLRGISVISRILGF